MNSPRTPARRPIGKVTAGCRVIAMVTDNVGVDSLSMPIMNRVEMNKEIGKIVHSK